MASKCWWGYDYCTLGYDDCLYGKKSWRPKIWWGNIFFWQGVVLVARKIPDSMRDPDSIWQKHPGHFMMYASTPLAYHYDCYHKKAITDEQTKKYHIDDNILKQKKTWGGFNISI